MSQESHRGRFWDFTLVWKFWVFKEGSGEGFGCNNGKNKKYGKIGVKVRFGYKVSQIWKIQIIAKYSNISEYEVVPKSPGWEDIQTLKIFKLGWNLKICLGGSLATSNPYIFTERAFRKTSYFERFEFFWWNLYFLNLTYFEPKFAFYHDFHQFLAFTRIATKSLPRPFFKQSIFWN